MEKRVKIELVEIVNDSSNTDEVAKVVTAVYRPVSEAKEWAKKKNAGLDFYGNRQWVICD